MTARRSETPTPKRGKRPTASARKRLAAGGLREQLDQRTHELGHTQKLLAEAREQQSATSEVLRIISSSPGELRRVFDTILQHAVRICEAKFGNLFLIKDGSAHWAAGMGTPAKLVEFFTRSPWFRPTAGSHLDRVIRTKQLSHAADDTTEAVIGAAARLGDARSTVCVPMLEGDALIGAIFIYRTEVRPFSDDQIELVATFARQAVIAIENARLLTQLRESTQDLGEALLQQTATSEVLEIISSSPRDLGPVFDNVLEKATRVCSAEYGSMVLVDDGGLVRQAALYNAPALLATARANKVFRPHPEGAMATAMRTRQPVHVADVRATAPYVERMPYVIEMADLGGARTIVVVPLLRANEAIGAMTIYRREVRPFAGKQIELLSNFARQAVIAIENARLFGELRDREAELRVTFDSMGDAVVMFGADTRMVAWNRNFQTILDLPDAFLVQRPNYADYFRYLAERGEYSADLEAELSRLNQDPRQELRIERTRPDGRVIEVRRNPVPGGGFVLIYGDITERKRAEEQIRAARDAAEKALRELQVAQASLVHAQKMAALGQLTAGIAHEIKNPLNFVNNFAALSSELTDELSDVLKPVALPGDVREEVKELTGTLKDNLGKVVQHGKRADSIVKNMLLHSREGSGERRPVEINAIIDESLNLAFHGARAEKQGFNITLERDFDPAIGIADVYPQEITRVLLNLISNGFYAATQRAGMAGNGFEPTLKAVTRNLGDRVEVRICDNGTGIPSDIREKIFNPFFTTKPAGEGTGLGLSMSHDIIVKQHGGTIEVVTEPGSFTEFIITLPRVMP